MTAAREWPPIRADGRWPATRDYLHLICQMVGKLRLALAPPQPEWFHTSLSLTPRGLTTRLLPIPAGAIEASLDIVDGVVRLSASGDRVRTVDIEPVRPISGIWSDMRAGLQDLGVTVGLWDKPQERADVTPFSVDDRVRDYDPELAAGWLALLTDVHALFDAWRSPFFGRSGVNFWWGGFDITVALYNGRHAVPPPGSNYLMRHDLDAEHLTIGFWPGDEDHDPMFFAYLVPQPSGCAEYPIDVPPAAWSSDLEEWVLPYALVRSEPDRYDIVGRFMEGAYRAAGDLAGWDRSDLTYVAPEGAPGLLRDGPRATRRRRSR